MVEVSEEMLVSTLIVPFRLRLSIYLWTKLLIIGVRVVIFHAPLIFWTRNASFDIQVASA